MTSENGSTAPAGHHIVPAGLYRRLAGNIGWLVGGTGATALLTMGALAFAARGLSIDQFGLLMLLQSAALTVRGLFGVGTQQPIIHLGSAALNDNDAARMGRLIGFGLILDFASAAVAAAAAVLLILFFGDLIGITGETRSYALLFAFVVLFMGYLSSNGLFRLANQFGLMTLVQCAATALLCVAAGAFYVMGAPFELYVYAWAAYLALSVQLQLAVALLLMMRRGVRTRFDIRRLPDEDRRLFRTYAWSTWGTIVVQTLRMHADSLLVGGILSVSAVGIYNVAKQLAGVLRKLTDNFASAIFPEVTRLAARGEHGIARRLLIRLLWIALAVGLVGVAAVAVAGRPVLRLGFGDAFVDGYVALLLLTMAASLQLIIQSFAVFIQVYRSPAQLLWIYLIGLAVYVPAAFLGSMALGIAGAALGQIGFAVAVILISALYTKGAVSAANLPPAQRSTN